MDYLGYILLAVVAFIFIERYIPARGVRHISIGDFKKELKDKNKQLIDVRTPEEFAANHIKGFKNIPLSKLSEKANSLSKEKEVVLICQSGLRSNKGSKILKKLGFKQVTNIKGGL